MSTARELLAQADALMRRNRSGGDIPVLTDDIPDESPAADSEADIPLLTDQVEEVLVEAVALSPQSQSLQLVSGPMLEGDPSNWLVMDTIDPALHSVTGQAPDTLAVVPPVTQKTVMDFEPYGEEPRSPVTLKAAGSEPTPPPAGSITAVASAGALEDEIAVDRSEIPVAISIASASTEDERWQTMADHISMQVLQRLDLFTDTGLKEQLAERLQPIVARAGAELVTAINEHVGKLVRAYVAEAIEREIAQWRKDH